MPSIVYIFFWVTRKIRLSYETCHYLTVLMLRRTYSCWRWNGARQKRPMSSIVLQPGVKDMLLADCKDFLQSEEWYASLVVPQFPDH
jgi:chaperone BCS1